MSLCPFGKPPFSDLTIMNFNKLPRIIKRIGNTADFGKGKASEHLGMSLVVTSVPLYKASLLLVSLLLEAPCPTGDEQNLERGSQILQRTVMPLRGIQ